MYHGASAVAKRKSAPPSDAVTPDRKWEIEDALRTLNRADEIRKNKQMMGDVKKLATEQIKSLSKHLVAADDKKPSNALMRGGKR